MRPSPQVAVPTVFWQASPAFAVALLMHPKSAALSVGQHVVPAAHVNGFVLH